MQCQQCGTQLPQDAVFCVRCGNAINKTNKKVTKSAPLVKKVLLILLLLIIIGGAIIFRNTFTDKEVSKTNIPHTQSSTSKQIAQQSGVHETSIEKDNHSENNMGVSVQSNISSAPVCQAYMNIQVDGDYLYHLEGNKSVSMFRRLNILTGELEVVCKDDWGIKSNDGKFTLCSVQSFLILGEYLYFSASFREAENFPVAYFRIPKHGGEAELLFLLPQSYMVFENGKIYFLFNDERQIGIYDPSKDTLPSFLPVMGDPIARGYNASPFSVADGYLYYEGIEEGGQSYKDKNFYCIDTATGETKKLIESSKNGLGRIKQGIFVGDIFYYTADFYTDLILIKAYNISTEKNRIIHGFKGMDNFFALYNNHLLFPESDYGQYSMISIDELSDEKMFYEGKPYDYDTSKIDAAVSAALGRDSSTQDTKDDEDKVIDRSNLDKYSAGLMVGHGEFYNIIEDKKISINSANTNPLFLLEEQNALKTAIELIKVYKDKDISKGILP